MTCKFFSLIYYLDFLARFKLLLNHVLQVYRNPNSFHILRKCIKYFYINYLKLLHLVNFTRIWWIKTFYTRRRPFRGLITCGEHVKCSVATQYMSCVYSIYLCIFFFEPWLWASRIITMHIVTTLMATQFSLSKLCSFLKKFTTRILLWKIPWHNFYTR